MVSRLNPIDKIVSFFNPVSGIRRTQARSVISSLSSSDGYQIPGSRRKAMRGSTATLNSPARDIDNRLTGMKAISRDMAMNTSLATSIFRRFRSNVIGSGLLVQPRVDQKFLGLTDDQADKFNDYAIRVFDLWSNSPQGDYTGSATPNELEGLLYVSSLINGDVFFTLPWVTPQSSLWPFETTVRVIDGDLVRTPDIDFKGLTGHSSTFEKIRNGIEFDSNGRLAAYWVANFYSDDSTFDQDSRNWERIPVFGKDGRRQMFHLLDHERISQRRGIPLLAPVVEQLSMYSQLEQSELMSALVSSFFSVIVRDQSGLGGRLQEGFVPEETVGGGGGYGPDEAQEEKLLEDSYNLEMGYGNIMYLDDDKDITMAETRDKKDVAPFLQEIATHITSATDIPYEVVAQVFQKSYSAMRGAINEAGKKFRTERTRVSNRVKRHWYEAIMYELVLKGNISAPKFFNDLIYRKAWCRSIWIGAGQGSVDPLKEAHASSVLVRNAQATREEEYMIRTGERWSPMVDRLAKEEAYMLEKGLLVNPEDKVQLTDERRENKSSNSEKSEAEKKESKDDDE